MIPFLDLHKINAQYAKDLKKAAAEVIDSGWYLMGERLRLFEDNLASYIGINHAIGVGNGFDALRIILRGYIELGKIKEGDEVIVPANTYIASILAITHSGLKPVFIEPDIATYNLNLSLIEQNISKRTRAIMVVHLYGRVCWSEKLEEIAERYGLIIIEDNAQGLGAKWKGKRTGALGDAAGLSFYPGKNLGALGDAGAITTNNSSLAEIVRALGNYGSKKKYINEYIGYNSRLDEIQAAFLDIKLGYLDQENYRRRVIASHYCQNINDSNIELPYTGDLKKIKLYEGHVWHLFVIRLKCPVILQSFLENFGIYTLMHYPVPPHKQNAYKKMYDIKLPVTEKISNEVLSLPISSVMKDDDVEKVISAINEWLKKFKMID